MERSLQYSYNQSLDSLEDLKMLIDPELGNFIDQAIFHLIDLKSKVDNGKRKDLQAYSSLRSLLEVRIDEILKRILKTNPFILSCILEWNPSCLRLESWNTIIESFDSIFEILAIFKFKKSLNVSICDGMIDLSGFISLEDWEVDYRTKVYKITRALLERKTLLTYHLLDKDEKNLYQIRLRLDFSNRENLVYCVDLKDSLDLMLCFSNIVANYKVKKETALELEDHHCIEITDKLEMIKHTNIPRDTFNGYTKNVLHFPFLFRPISLIIPRGGEIISMEELSSSIKFQNEKKLQTDFLSNSIFDNKKIYFLDFFSFFCEKNSVSSFDSQNSQV